jgi:hypothetical protein
LRGIAAEAAKVCADIAEVPTLLLLPRLRPKHFFKTQFLMFLFGSVCFACFNFFPNVIGCDLKDFCKVIQHDSAISSLSQLECPC